MNQIKLLILTLFLILTGSLTVVCQSSVSDMIRQSHIDGNVPEKKDFDNFLKRDLTAYFKEAIGKDVIVEYTLLRSEPTQSGVALPKFYAWVRVREKDRLIEEGAVRIAAIEKKQFEVIQHLKREDIKRDGEQVYKLFPKPVAEKIIEEFINLKKGSF